MSSTQSQSDAPSWVQAEVACRHAWEQDRAWRKAARRALHEVHRSQLAMQARRAYGQESGAGRRAREDRHHAQECPCAQCRRKRGEKALPTLQQQQERRKDARGVEPGDREDWLLSSDARVRFARLAEVWPDEQRKALCVLLRTAFAQHLDAWRLFGALERLLEERPAWGAALVACDLQGRPSSAVAATEGITPATVRHRRRCARRYLAALYAGEEPQRAHSPPPAAHASGCAGTGATLAALDEAARVAQCPSVADYVRRIVLAPL